MPDGMDVKWGQRSEDFAAALLDPDIPIPNGVGKEGGDAPKRFSVYRNNVVVGLLDAVAAAFPSLHTIMGEETFRLVARNYIAAHPPSSPVMQHYGASFSAFLAAFPPLRKSPFLTDVALVERAWLDAYHSPDVSPLDPAVLQDFAESDVVSLLFRPHPATTLVRSSFPVVTLFEARHQWPAPSIDMEEGQAALVTRSGVQVTVTQWHGASAAMIESLIDGAMLGEAIAEAQGQLPDFDPGPVLGQLFALGAFSHASL